MGISEVKGSRSWTVKMRLTGAMLVPVSLMFFPLAPLRADAVDDYINAEMKNSRIPGLSLAVVKDGRLIRSAGYGLSNVETATPATPGTVYKVASLSKPILAAAVMLLEQQGKLGLDDKVARYLSGSPPSWQDITVRHLLSHTSGIARDPADYHPYKEQRPSAVIESAFSMPLQFQPGEKWLYSNIGYFALAEIISKASGMPWSDFIAKQLFEPAGMASTRLTSASAIIPNRARGYETNRDGMLNAEDWIAVRPSGAYVSTVLDLANLDIFIDSHSPLDDSRRAAMKTPARLPDGKSAAYGLGWNVDSYLGQERIHHGGQYPGFRSTWERFENQRLSIIVLANSSSARVESLALRIAGFYSPELVAPEFSTSAAPTTSPLPIGKQAIITVVARSVARSAPDSVLELEVWDEANKAVHKQSRTSQSFSAGESRTYEFAWTPTKAGKYTVNVGVYGPNWTPSYSWHQGMATITVE
jgi:CubicO group peptidase (beta-lactamase class C family)